MEHQLITSIRLFVDACRVIDERQPGSGLTFTLSVGTANRYETLDKPKIKLECQFYDGTSYQTVSAASLDTLMGEVRRRLGFEDREALRLKEIEESFKALPAPQPHNDIPF